MRADSRGAFDIGSTFRRSAAHARLPNRKLYSRSGVLVRSIVGVLFVRVCGANDLGARSRSLIGEKEANAYGPLELQHQPPADDAAAMLYLGRHHGQPRSQHSPRRVADEDKHLYENQLNQWSENNRMESYPNRDAQSPNKDKYIDLQDRGGGGDMLDYSGGDPSGQPGAGGGAGGGGKPKKSTSTEKFVFQE
ncbi:hypothetical protein RRG08_012453 [Elysia crispata]|uniref:Uncharacterized protein n=1 Tax=Elysia crispata TaxID=231223 RepID=A0AAE1B4G5_9GAST|nr:hypothetical protein RRG08_012453 [Elysia crispata]